MLAGPIKVLGGPNVSYGPHVTQAGLTSFSRNNIRPLIITGNLGCNMPSHEHPHTFFQGRAKTDKKQQKTFFQKSL